MSSSLLSPHEQQAPLSAIEEACRRVPPLFPLRNFVAVNPFLGLAGMPFLDAAQLLEKVAHGSVLLPAGHFLEQLRERAIDAADIQAALRSAGLDPTPSNPVSWLLQQLRDVESPLRIETVADTLDRQNGSGWTPFLIDEISKWCSSYFDCGQSVWEMPGKSASLYETWKRTAEIDANPEVFGLTGFRQFVRTLPDTAGAAIAFALETLDVPTHLAVDFLHRQLMTVPGWAAYAAGLDRDSASTAVTRELLAIRLAYDCALLPLAPGWQCRETAAPAPAGSLEARYIAQSAAEHAFRSSLLRKLQSRGPARPATDRKTLQAVFCIDVRSEPLRRALEAQSGEIQTIGFAGFFGLAISFESTARCPVLLSPSHHVSAASGPARPARLMAAAKSAWKNLATSAAACFSAVEVAGAAFGLSLLLRSARRPAPALPAPQLAWSIPLAERINLAAGALKNMSLRPERLARIVLICGHGSATENNPYGSSLDCGACGGHKGDVNARLAAAIMNDPAVRQGLRERGLAIPEDTVFIAGLHNTTSDDVVVFEENLLSAEDSRQLREWLDAAGNRARAARTPAGPPPATRSPYRLASLFRRRTGDWSEVRPEWGLAGNAAFIAAPRSKTESLDLEGRVFLHDYDATLDPDSSVLQLILTAPVVVASWINLQYYASTVNNGLYGSGNKVLHNVVGGFGIWEGNGGDLRSGLPLQSLHNGSRWIHEPLRLQVIVEAPRDRIEKVLARNPGVHDLVRNGWILLSAIEGDTVYERRPLGDWQESAAA